jgi:hypothetical protein
MNIELILKNQIAIMEVLKSNTNSEWHSKNLKMQIYDTDSEIHHLHKLDNCQHPFKEVVSGDEGMFCVKCQKYISKF